MCNDHFSHFGKIYRAIFFGFNRAKTIIHRGMLLADIKNLGGPEAGMISAGKFLENFVDYPWVHLDIAGPSILASKHGYRPKGGTGVGTRLLFEFIMNITENK